ncbi:MAG: VCBS repeat-containing protein [Candidatus Eisenbacteria bacterium]|nr:VCBS repeat-containing protein [Candidatus Eisenbacteria bacterium]
MPLAAAILVLASGVCVAQTIHWTQADDMVPQEYNFAFASGDLDGDLDQDLTIPGSNGWEYWNVGTPREPVWELDVNQFPGIPFCRDPMGSLGDIDGDGDLDLLLACFYWPCLRLYRNTGTPPGDPSWEYDPILEWFDWGGPKDPCLADIDADGDLDILMVASLGPLSLFENAGSPSSPDWTSPIAIGGITVGPGANISVALGDIDGDGDLDVVGGTMDTEPQCWENIGTPQSFEFIENPGLIASVIVDTEEFVSDFELVDLDSDGDQDLLIVTLTDHNYFFLNDGPVTPVRRTSWGTIKALYR